MPKTKFECECGNRIGVKLFLTSLYKPYECLECGKSVYSPTPVSGYIAGVLFTALVFIAFALFLKQAWVQLTISIVTVLVLCVAVRFIEINNYGVNFDTTEQITAKQAKSNLVGWVFAAIFILVSVVLYITDF